MLEDGFWFLVRLEPEEEGMPAEHLRHFGPILPRTTLSSKIECISFAFQESQEWLYFL